MENEAKTPFIRFLKAFVVLDRRWIFLSVGAIAVIFMTLNLKMPIPVSRQARDMYNAVESLPEGARVHMSIDYGPGSEAELWPQHIAIMKQLFRKHCKVIFSSLWSDGPFMIERGIKYIVPQLEKDGIKIVKGVDYIDLGYKAGDRVAITKIATSFKQTFPTDNEGNKTEGIPIMQGWDTYADVNLLITIAVGDPGAQEWIQQAQSRYNIPMVAGVTAVLSPQLYSFHQSKNLLGFLGGLAGAAEYEALVKEPAAATRGMNVQSAVHMLIVLLVILGNLAHFILRSRGETVR
ncbi:MAG: hypothetical protein V2A74_09755 [bacterium]